MHTIAVNLTRTEVQHMIAVLDAEVGHYWGIDQDQGRQAQALAEKLMTALYNDAIKAPDDRGSDELDRRSLRELNDTREVLRKAYGCPKAIGDCRWPDCDCVLAKK